MMNILNIELLPATLLYLDPGTGSLLFSVVMGSATAAFFVLKGFFFKNHARVLSLFGKQQVNTFEQNQRIVIYSEGRQYAGVFRPIIAEMMSRSIACLYLSSDEQDPLLSISSDLIKTKYIGSGYSAWGYLNTMTADVCMMTTPGLDVLQIKRSKNVTHYAHLIHSPTDKAFNRPYSFDYFDSVFICGPHQQQTMRHLEKLRNTPRKQLFMVGCVYYDEFALNYQLMKEKSEHSGRLRVLIAPTWGKNGLLTRYGLRVIQPLADAGFQVIVRPHPQSHISEVELIARLRKETEQYRNVTWDCASSPMEAMVNSDVLVSDISGVVFDYSFVTEKPVITLDFHPEKRGFEANDLPYEPWELRILDVVGKKVKESDIDRLKEIVSLEASDSSRKEKIRELRETYVVNFGHAASHVVDELETLLASPVRQSSISATQMLPNTGVN